MALSSLFTGMSDRARNFILRIMEGQRMANLVAMQEECSKWRPNGKWASYVEEMAARVNYLAGAMQEDMAEVLKRQLPNSYKELEREQMNLGIVRHLVLEKAQVFPTSTRSYLTEKKTGKELPDNDERQIVWQKHLWRRGYWLVGLRNGDAITQLCHRASLKPWWDDETQAVRLSVFPPHKVWIVPNPKAYWSVYGALTTMFEQPGFDGLNGSPRFEVYSAVAGGEVSTADDRVVPERLWVTDGHQDLQLNDNDENPYTDPETGQPTVPHVWFSDSTPDSIYDLGNEDLLTPNRLINWGLTALQQNIIWQGLGIPTIDVPAGKKVDLPKEFVVSPRHVLQLPPGTNFRFERPDLDVTQPLDFYSKIMQVVAILNHQDPQTVNPDGTTDVSGRALLVQKHRIQAHNRSMRPVYDPHVNRLLRLGVSILNKWGPSAGLPEIDLRQVEPVLEYGEVDAFRDPLEMADQYEREIESDVSTHVDWVKERHGLASMTDAESRLAENRKVNGEWRQARRAANPGPFDVIDDNQDDTDQQTDEDKAKAQLLSNWVGKDEGKPAKPAKG